MHCLRLTYCFVGIFLGAADNFGPGFLFLSLLMVLVACAFWGLQRPLQELGEENVVMVAAIMLLSLYIFLGGTRKHYIHCSYKEGIKMARMEVLQVQTLSIISPQIASLLKLMLSNQMPIISESTSLLRYRYIA